MRDRLTRWLIPPELCRDSRRFPQARRSLEFTVVLALAALVFAPIHYGLGSTVSGIGLLVAAILGTAAMIVAIGTVKSTVVAGNVLATALAGVILLICTRTGGGGAMYLAWLILVPMVVVALAGPRSAAVWTLLCGASYGVLLGPPEAARWFPQDFSPQALQFMELLSLCGLLLCSMALALLFETGEAQVRADLERSRRAAEVASRTKSEFLANMSHEIRTPMTAILGYADLLLGTASQPEQVEALQTIHRNGAHLLEIINDILDLSKIEAGRLGIQRQRCAPAQVVADVASLMRGRSEAKGLALQIESAGPVPQTIETDPLRLRQILLNLVGNAVKFTDAGQVRIVIGLVHSQQPGCSEAAGLLRFDVIDTGIGIAADQLPRLFQPFSQADATTTRRFGGTGLGLVISRRLAEMLGGTITAESTPGRGSTFRATVATGPLTGVPLRDGVDLPPCRESDRAASAVAEAEPALNCRVLLAEDGPDNQRLIAFVLRKAGAEVAVADNGQAAVEQVLAAMAAGQGFDLVLMDMQMPVLDGYTATSHLRAAGYRGPIVALTAHAMAADRDKCLAAGCDDYAPKPIDRRQLVRLVHEHTCAARPMA